jgi:hypothetical protein
MCPFSETQKEGKVQELCNKLKKKAAKSLEVNEFMCTAIKVKK